MKSSESDMSEQMQQLTDTEGEKRISLFSAEAYNSLSKVDSEEMLHNLKI